MATVLVLKEQGVEDDLLFRQAGLGVKRGVMLETGDEQLELLSKKLALQ